MRVKVERVTQLMEEKKLTPEDISYSTGLGIVSVKWIFDNGSISEEALERLADVLDIPVKEIFLPDYEDLADNGIEWLRRGKRATCQFSHGRFKTMVKRLAEKYPEQCEIVVENKDGSILAHVPLSWVKISPPRKLELSDEERAYKRDIFMRNCR